MVDNGTYVALNLDSASCDILRSIIERNHIPGGLAKDDFHVTLIYSRNELTDFVPAGVFKRRHRARIKEARVFDKCLVLVLDFPYAEARHHAIMEAHPEATWDYPEYIAHVTLTYDCGDIDPTTIKFRHNTALYACEEYSRPLESDWASNKGSNSMIFNIAVKVPDEFDDQVGNAISNRIDSLREEGVDEDTIELQREGWLAEAEEIKRKWMKYGEILTIKFDSSINAAVVIPQE